MKLELIKSFAVLGETCHFGAASRRLGISQPSLTKQVRRLEDLLGAPLFSRNRQGTELTAFGRRFLDEVQPVLRHADHVWEKGIKAARGESGHLAIGFTFSAVEIMSKVLFEFQSRYPDIELSFDDVASGVQAARITEGGLDVGFVRLPTDSGLAYHRVARDRLAFVFPASMADEIENLDSACVAAQPFIGLQEQITPGLERHIQLLFNARGFKPRVMHRVNGPLTILSLVAAGLGVALMHESSLRGVVTHVGGILVSPVEDPIASWDVGLVWRPGEQNPAVIRFLHVARKIILQAAASPASPRDPQGWRLPPLPSRRR